MFSSIKFIPQTIGIPELFLAILIVLQNCKECVTWVILNWKTFFACKFIISNKVLAIKWSIRMSIFTNEFFFVQMATISATLSKMDYSHTWMPSHILLSLIHYLVFVTWNAFSEKFEPEGVGMVCSSQPRSS